MKKKIWKMNNTHNASCGFLKMNLAKYFQPFQWKTTNKHFFFFFFFVRLARKGKEIKTRKSEGKERRRRAKSKGCALCLNHIGYFTSFLNKKKTAWPHTFFALYFQAVQYHIIVSMNIGCFGPICWEEDGAPKPLNFNIQKWPSYSMRHN